MSEMGWRDAIIKVLRNNSEPMHYSEIAEAIEQEGLKKEFGATPANSVNATICVSLQKDPENSPFMRVGYGIYSLKEKKSTESDSHQQPQMDQESPNGDVLIKAFGMYWQRDKVFWESSTARLLGRQQQKSATVDFSDQKGVYLLHDGSSVVYVGRTTNRKLGIRLKEHTVDRLNGRWNRFSWFGICGVSEDGKIQNPPAKFSQEGLITTLEALLIEGLEPPQNRKGGDRFRAVEFLQVEDDEIKKKQINQWLEEMKRK